MCIPCHLLAVSSWWSTHWAWVVAGVALLLTFALGWSDVARFRLSRIWTLSGTCYVESVRKRVWLVAILGIAGVIVVVQLQRPADEQDAIRQTIKYCLFASGMLVTVTALILACTNLPREIESRVIYTVVTKPTTRLEIVLGKVVGFARVSGLIILIMGVFTFGYLEVRNWNMMRGVSERLRDEPADSVQHAAMAYWAATGFLDTKSLDFARGLSVYSRLPTDDGIKWMGGGKSQYMLVPFRTSDNERALLAEAQEKGADVDLLVTLKIDRHPPTPEELKVIKQLNIKPAHAPVMGPELPATKPAGAECADIPAQIKVRFLDDQHRELASFDDTDNGSSGLTIVPSVEGRPGLILKLKEAVLDRLARTTNFFVEISAITPSIEFGAAEMPVVLFVPAADQGKQLIKPIFVNDHPVPPIFLARNGHRGMILMGDANGKGSLAVYQFRNAEVGNGNGGKVAFQINVYFERNGDFQGSDNSFSIATLDVVNHGSGKTFGPIKITPEIDRTTYFDLPAEAVAGGNFDVILRDLTTQQELGLDPLSLALVTADRSFAFNLIKSLLVLWMLATLVVVIAVFCSTFLSWPIAIVLTLIILLGRWGVNELGDALNPGVGRMVAGDFRVSDPGVSLVMSKSVEALSSTLKNFAATLPDVSKFPVSEDIERGISTPPAKILDAAQILLLYGIILISMSYLILRHKEVAP